MIPWVEKYRPKTISEVSHQVNPVSMLNQIMPHLIFYGPPGTGKTSAALALARQLFGREGLKERILELNASDDRGIDVVREKIKTYARLNISKNRINTETGRPMPPWKIIILDEADMITPDAQAALRRAIETYSTITRFIFICNYIYKIIDPLCSRCSLQRFQPISKEAQIKRLEYICQEENITKFTTQAMEALVRISNGDLRRSITLLQARSLYKSITEDIVCNVAGIPPRQVVIDLLKSCKGSLEDVDKAVKYIIDQGWDVANIMSQICDIVANDGDLDDISKARISLELSNRDFALFQGASQYFQLLSLCHHIREILYPIAHIVSTVYDLVPQYILDIEMTHDSVNVAIYVNRFDSESKTITINDLPINTTIGRIKSDHFANDIISNNKIRFIYRGVNIDDNITLSKFESFDGIIKIIVFITKPSVVNITNAKTEARVWSTFGCITFVFIMWFYKLKFSDTFNWTANAIFYIATMITLHTIITSNVFRNVT